MALTPMESSILALLDQGLTEQDICELGFAAGTVHRTVATFGSRRRNDAAEVRYAKEMKRASDTLRQRIELARAG
jgi:hypothetical protein